MIKSGSKLHLSFHLIIFRYVLSAKFSDESGEAWLTVFNEEAETLLGCSADDLAKMKEQVLVLYSQSSHLTLNLSGCSQMLFCITGYQVKPPYRMNMKNYQQSYLIRVK